jgi:hypothetical protein
VTVVQKRRGAAASEPIQPPESRRTGPLLSSASSAARAWNSSRALGVTAATLAGWRDDCLAGGQAALKSRPADARDEEIARLRAKVGALTMDNELLLQRCQADRPLSRGSNPDARARRTDGAGLVGSGARLSRLSARRDGRMPSDGAAG